MKQINITTEGTSKSLKNLNPSKAIGPDKISLHFLKEVHHEISPMISDLFNSSVNTGTVPNDWREALVTPVFKKGAKSKPENYRPICLTCILSKSLEHIIVSSIMKHLDIHDLLYPLQHGFRSKVSCETQLSTFTQQILDYMANGKQIDVVVMDFPKAFDKVLENVLKDNKGGEYDVIEVRIGNTDIAIIQKDGVILADEISSVDKPFYFNLQNTTSKKGSATTITTLVDVAKGWDGGGKDVISVGTES
ncbi:Hypothetical predicted protein [Mytilus galloprovincialis]|uniref:Reverse transcriptase domain-containing protein n=1 Tax=Mytilus galloprovincialis TaxID=29158 RepID=A0A8B6CKE2_MYTGA|nr:Hypothetical predicted protein [Mytilus galloprovincialis]